MFECGMIQLIVQENLRDFFRVVKNFIVLNSSSLSMTNSFFIINIMINIPTSLTPSVLSHLLCMCDDAHSLYTFYKYCISLYHVLHPR